MVHFSAHRLNIKTLGCRSAAKDNSEQGQWVHGKEKNICQFLLWFYDLVFSHQILTYRPCHYSYLRPWTENGDTTFILPTWTAIESSVCKGMVMSHFLLFAHISPSKSSLITPTVIFQSSDWLQDNIFILPTPTTIESKVQGRWG